METEDEDYYEYLSMTAEQDKNKREMFLQFNKIFLVCMYSVTCIVGISGNSLVLIVLIFYEKVKVLSDIFLVSLAIADLCFLCTLPFWAYMAADEWIFHTLPCKLIRGLYTMNLYGSMLTLTCITIDRYFAIVQATKAHVSQAKRRIWGTAACILVWVISLAFAMPQFIFSIEASYGKKVCHSSYPSEDAHKFTEIIQMVLGFLLPIVVMVVFYSIIANTLFKARGFHKHKSLQIIFAIVVTFILTQTPYNILKITRVVDQRVAMDFSFDYGLVITEAIAYFHGCLNPILYFFIGVKFRKNLAKILKKFGCIKQQITKQGQTTDEDISKTCTDTHNMEETSMYQL
nr:C-X-C chemokine receptor type 6 [Anolis sagrei ordinatus]